MRASVILEKPLRQIFECIITINKLSAGIIRKVCRYNNYLKLTDSFIALINFTNWWTFVTPQQIILIAICNTEITRQAFIDSDLSI